ncbi:MAG: zinc ribbon domain-containing protein [Acidimicrobiales bacterium]
MSETNVLRALMEVDRWIDRVGSQRTHLPEISQLATLEGELRGLLKDLHEAEAGLVPVKFEFENASRDSSRLKGRANDLDATLATSTANARELTALQSELSHVRDLLATSEERELELLVDLEPREEAIESIKRRAQPGVARRSELVDVIAQLQATLDDELGSLRLDRDARHAAVAEHLRARYDVAMTRAGTSGAAQVVEGRCDGCRLALAPLDVDRFKSLAPDTFMDCPECGRLLIP